MPAGTRVYLGRRLLGKTPLKNAPVTTGAFRLRLTRHGHRTRSEAVPAGEGPLRLDYRMDPAPVVARGQGTLRVAALVKGKPVRALVFLDGKRTGETPLAVKVSTGRHKVEAWRGAKARGTKVVYVKANQTHKIIITIRGK